ncbi:MAG: SCO family protein, partial [Planctomycetota bacterium]
PAALLRHTGAAALAVAGSAGLFAAIGAEPARGELPFPAEALRTVHPAPELALTNQAGELVELSALRGKVVVVTAVYASCPHTCPLILAQTKRAVEELADEELADLRVVAVTLDPEHDSPEVLSELARLQGLETPLYNLVTGEPAEVERVLDRMGVARQRNPETGVIDHANLFLVLDRNGAVAYRFGLGERQARWLVSALRVLLRETPQAASHPG